jgi:uncharacterized membrane protein YkvA (DUF1232 family)
MPDLNMRDFVTSLPDIGKLLWRVVRDDRVSTGVRGGLVGVAAYLALPFDIIPDWIPLLGQLDDFVVITLGVRILLRRVPEPILLDHWDGEDDILHKLLGRKLRESTAPDDHA